MRDVNHGWLLRYIHMNAHLSFQLSLFIFSVVYYGSYKAPRTSMDAGCSDSAINDGNSIYGICSSLGADVVLGCNGYTNLFSALPFIGESIVTWLGGVDFQLIIRL